MIKLMGILFRKRGMDHSAFKDHYENKHVPVALEHAGHLLLEYKRTYVDLPLLTDTYAGRNGDHDGPDVITEMTFTDQVSADRYFSIILSVSFFMEDEERFLDRKRSRGGAVSSIEQSLG